MSWTAFISRREAISFLFGCLLTTPAVSATHDNETVEVVSNFSRHLEAVFRHWESARRIGLAYRMAYPHECNADDWLSGILGADLASGTPGPEINELSVRQSIARNIQLDFENDNVVSLDGWVLSRTEARLCVAVYML